MDNGFLGKLAQFFRKRLMLLIFLTLSLVIFLLSSTFILKGSSADILLIFVIWCLPLFIH